MRLLLDEMYPPALAADLQAVGIDAISIYELGMAGTADPDVFAYAVADDRALLTENVADLSRSPPSTPAPANITQVC